MGRTSTAPTEGTNGLDATAIRRRRGRPPARLEVSSPAAPSADALEMLSFGALLKLLRERRDLSQGTLAQRIGKSTSLISLFESDQRHPTSDTVNDLVRALHLTVEEQHQLVRSAGFAEGDVSSAVVRIVDVLGQHLDLGDADRASLLADLNAQVTGWQALFRASKRFHVGDLETAHAEFARLSSHAEYSPTLATQVHIYLADALSQSGQLTAASDLVREERKRLEYAETAPGWLPWQRAEVKSMQAMVAKREGDYEMAAALLQQSVAVYERLLAGSAEDERIAFAGLGKTYKQLAEVTLLQGVPAVALRYCANAEAHLSLAHHTALMQLYVRRTLGLKAWACSLLRDFARAEALRGQVRDLCLQAGDAFGLAKNALFEGDDLRRQIRIALATPDDKAPEREPEARRKQLRDILRRDNVSEWVEAAERCYADALAGLKEVSDRLLLGRCHRGMGIILRYKAIRNGTANDFDEARGHLDQALGIENANGQRRRLPSIYESIAELEWDRGDLTSAAAYYDAALELLDRALAASPDAASAGQRARVHTAIDVLRPAGKLDLPRSRRLEGHAAGVLSSSRWHDLSVTLVRTVREFVVLSNTTPISLVSDSPEWEEKTLELDVAPGPRLLAQNRLSSSLSPRIPGASVLEAAARHVGRFHSFAARVQMADRHRDDQSRDLCCRPEVERALNNPDLRLLTMEQVRTAFEYMSRYGPGYHLESGQYRLPLGFAVKGTRTLVEIPERLAVVFPKVQPPAGAEHGALTLCYAFESEALAEQLRRIFDDLVEEADASVRSDTCAWLKDLIRQPPRAKRESVAM